MKYLFMFLALPKSNKLLHRSFDIAGSAIGIYAFALQAIAIAITLKLKMGSPIILKQERVGLGGKTFMMLKFRSMTNDRHTDGELLPDALRVTPVGKWLRRWTLDEVPQFINIICGDMSIIGPRPALAKKIERLRDAGYSEELRYA